ncbi:unnamed protein product [Durusdinium trenchii]|uniref:Uncharacterized protein n=1 Tax=Durusdinium trenchii TaxID=1381693 RepID=A0ABP0T1V6_9DINO
MGGSEGEQRGDEEQAAAERILGHYDVERRQVRTEGKGKLKSKDKEGKGKGGAFKSGGCGDREAHHVHNPRDILLFDVGARAGMMTRAVCRDAAPFIEYVNLRLTSRETYGAIFERERTCNFAPNRPERLFANACMVVMGR